MMYSTFMDRPDMLDTNYLFQPRGPGTAYLFRMATPAVLLGRVNPRTGRPYGREIREGLKGAKVLRDAFALVRSDLRKRVPLARPMGAWTRRWTSQRAFAQSMTSGIARTSRWLS
jgi:hypothetical protein